jgi:hypothetical protein
LRARQEPTQLEHVSDTSFLGTLRVFLANVRLDWKVIACYKHSSLFGLVVSDEGKKVYNIDSRYQFHKTFFGMIYNPSSVTWAKTYGNTPVAVVSYAEIYFL